MTTKIASLAVEIGVDSSKLEAGLKATKTQLQGIGKEAETAGSKIGAFAGGFAKFAAVGGITALGAAFIETTKSAMELETTFGKIAALTDTPKSAIAGLRDEVLKLSTDIPVSANEMSKALYFISSSGIKGADAMKVLEVSSKAAAAGLGETQIIADAVTSALNAYGLGADKASKITDILIATVREGKGEPTELAGSLGKVLPIAAQAGVSMEQVAASMATMTRTGMNADEAATSLRGTIAALMAPGKQAVDALAAIGLTTDDVAQRLRSPEGLVGVLQLLMERTGGNVAALDAIIPNIRALTGVLSTAGSQGAEYARILGEMQNAAGATDKAFTSMSDTAEFKLKKAENSIAALGQTVAKELLPYLGQAADAMVVLFTASDKVNAAFDASAESVTKNSKSYEEYKNTMIDLAVQAQKMPKVYADMIKAGKTGGGFAGEDLTARILANAGILSEETWKLTQSNEVLKKSAVMAGEAATESFAGMGAAARMAAENTRGFSDAFSESAAAAGRAAKEGFAGMTAGLGAPKVKVGIEFEPLDNKASAEQIKAMTKDWQAWFGAITQDTFGLKGYNEQQKTLEIEARKVKEEIDKLTASQGAQVTVTKNNTMSANELTAKQAQLAKVQEDLTSGARKRNETDAEYSSRMADLQVKADNLTASINGASGATSSYIDNTKKIDELKGKYDELNGKIKENADVHGEATKRMILGMLEQRLAIGGLTKEEQDALLGVAKSMGLVDQATVDAMIAVNGMADSFNAGKLGADGMKNAALGLVDTLNGIPRDLQIAIQMELSGISMEELRDIKGLPQPGAATPAPAAPVAKPATTRRGGAQAASGADFIVPRGFPRDSFNLGVTSGEHVLVEPAGSQSSTTTNNISINIAGISRDYTPQQAGDELLERLRSRGLVA